MQQLQLPKENTETQTQQSPINIVARDAFDVSEKLTLTGFERISYRGSIQSKNRHLSFVLSGTDEELPRTVFRSTVGILKSIHFHAGSEHAIDGAHFDAEFHFVHDIVRSEKPTDAHTQEPSSNLVIAVFANSVDDRGEASRFCEVLKTAKANVKGDDCKCADNCEFPEEIVNAVLTKIRSFYHYRGSLTTHPTNEVVSWIVLNEPISVKKSLIKSISELNQGPRKELQDLKRRIVVYSR